MVAWLAPRPGMAVLDVAGGTGDIARRVLAAMEGKGRVIVCDASEQMVDAGRERTWNAGILGGIEWLVGDAEALPLPARLGGCVHDRLRHPQPDPDRAGAGGSRAHSQARRALPLP